MSSSHDLTKIRCINNPGKVWKEPKLNIVIKYYSFDGGEKVFSHSLNSKIGLTWPYIHSLMKDKYGSEYPYTDNQILMSNYKFIEDFVDE